MILTHPPQPPRTSFCTFFPGNDQAGNDYDDDVNCAGGGADDDIHCGTGGDDDVRYGGDGDDDDSFNGQWSMVIQDVKLMDRSNHEYNSSQCGK